MTGRVARRAVVPCALALMSGLAACGGDDRPTDAAWASEWEREQSIAPMADDLAAGGDDRCDELTGRFREVLPRLTPSPSEALDAAVEAWIDHAESLVFDCPDDPDEVARRLDELAVLAAEVDAGLATERSG